MVTTAFTAVIQCGGILSAHSENVGSRGSITHRKPQSIHTHRNCSCGATRLACLGCIATADLTCYGRRRHDPLSPRITISKKTLPNTPRLSRFPSGSILTSLLSVCPWLPPRTHPLHDAKAPFLREQSPLWKLILLVPHVTTCASTISSRERRSPLVRLRARHRGRPSAGKQPPLAQFVLAFVRAGMTEDCTQYKL